MAWALGRRMEISTLEMLRSGSVAGGPPLGRNVDHYRHGPFQDELAHAGAGALSPLIVASGGNSGSQATSLSSEPWRSEVSLAAW